MPNGTWGTGWPTTGAGGAVPHQAQMEQAFGQDFSNVQAYHGKSSQMDALGANAAARGEPFQPFETLLDVIPALEALLAGS